VPAFTPSELFQILTDFRRRLEAIVAYCEQIGAVPILVIPASNESGFEPNRTVLSARVSQAERAALTERFQQARALETDDPAQSQTRYRSLLDRQPDFAEAHFRLGRLLERAGAFDEAREHYIRARDLDGFPVRCRSDLAQIYLDVAARHNSILVDGSELLRARSRHGILDDELCHDAHHPSLASHLNLAQAVLDQLHKRRALGLGGEGAPAPIIDPAECAAHFQIDFQVWAGVCVKSGMYFKHSLAARYESREREAKHLRFAQAAVQIGQRLRLPEQMGIPGVGLPPPVSYRWDWWTESPPPAPGQTHRENPSSPVAISEGAKKTGVLFLGSVSASPISRKARLSSSPAGEPPPGGDPPFWQPGNVGGAFCSKMSVREWCFWLIVRAEDSDRQENDSRLLIAAFRGGVTCLIDTQRCIINRLSTNNKS